MTVGRDSHVAEDSPREGLDQLWAVPSFQWEVWGVGMLASWALLQSWAVLCTTLAFRAGSYMRPTEPDASGSRLEGAQPFPPVCPTAPPFPTRSLVQLRGSPVAVGAIRENREAVDAGETKL